MVFSGLTYHLGNTEIGVFGYTVLSDSKEDKLRSRDQDVSPSASKNEGILLVPFRAWKYAPTAISIGVGISKVSWRMSFQ